MEMYETPRIVDYGSLAQLTLSRRGSGVPDGARGCQSPFVPKPPKPQAPYGHGGRFGGKPPWANKV